MLIYEYKLDGAKAQYAAIDEAIRICQFIRNKCLRKWMDEDKIGKKALQVSILPDMGGAGRLAPGQMLKQRYRIVTLVGRGGMGSVYKAEDTQFGGCIIAVKEMSQSNLSSQEAAEATEQFKIDWHCTTDFFILFRTCLKKW